MNLKEVKVHKKQGRALSLLRDNSTSYILFGGGSGGGKSWIGCLWLLIMCLKYPGTRWFLGREELKRLRTSTLQTFYKVCKEYGITSNKVDNPSDPHYKYNGQDHFIEFTNGSRIDLLELKYIPSDPMYERFGSLEFTGGYIEEGGEIDFGAFDVLKSRIGRHRNDEYGLLKKMLVTANPKKNWMYRLFYKPWKANGLPDEYAFIQSLIGDNKYRESGSEEALKDIENEATRQRLLYGNWEYEDDPEQLIKYEWIEQAFENEYNPGKSKLGVDVARFGDDDTVLAYLMGNALKGLDFWNGIDTTKTAQRVKEYKEDRSIDSNMIGVDVVGLGAGVVDTLTGWDINVKEIISGAKPEEDKDSAYEFKNLRSQMWWWLRDAFKEGRIRLEFRNERMIEDLTAPRYSISGDKVVQVEAKDKIKKRIGRSPDYGDAVVYGWSVPYINKPKGSLSPQKVTF